MVYLVKSVYHDLQTYLLNASQLLLNQLLSNVTDVEINKASTAIRPCLCIMPPCMMRATMQHPSSLTFSVIP